MILILLLCVRIILTVAQKSSTNEKDILGREEDFTSAIGDEFATKSEFHARILPTLKVNSNDLNWLKEQKSSKGSSLRIQVLAGDAVRCATHSRKTSTFYVAPINPKEDPEIDDTEEFKTAPSTTEVVPQFSVYCECGNSCAIDQTLCNICLQKQELVEMSGNLYVTSNNGFKPIWVYLLNKEMYCNF